jgi:hypothetical protein
MGSGRTRALVGGLVVAGVLCVAAAVSSGGTTAGSLVLGVFGDPVRFQHETGQVSHTRLLVVGWGQGATHGSSFADLFRTMLTEPMLGLSTGLQHGGAITPGQIALGSGDGYLVAINHAIRAWGKPIFFRPFAEMNAYWSAYSAYTRAGPKRDDSHTTALFRAAFARVYLIVHGGPGVNGTLAKLGQPPVHSTPYTNSNVQVIWNPQGRGAPDTSGNSAAAYYPGDSYVDVVGDDLYDIRFNADWRDAEALYKAHPTKPFAFSEWAPWGIDDPDYVGRMAAFAKTHIRVSLISYYSGRPGSLFDLARKPKTLAAYRTLIVPLGRP